MKPALAVLSLSILTVACGGNAPHPEADPPPTPVSTVRADVGDVASTFEAGGIVRAGTSAAIASRLLAPVLTVHVRAGDRVRRGALLITLEGREISAEIARARAMAQGTGEGVRAAEGTVRAAEAALALARATHERVRALHAKRSATPHELDQATAAFDGAQAHLDAARASLAAAVASRTAAGAAVSAAAATQADTTLRAPFDGVITDRAVDPGDMATPGVRLLTLEDTRTLRLDVTLDEARAATVAKGQAVRVSLEPLTPDDAIEATIGEIARVDPASHSFLLKLDLPASTSATPGAFGRAQFTGPGRKALTIPASAVIRRGQLTFVYLVEGDRVRLQPIATGLRTGDRLEILAGLDDRALVVANPPASLADGVRVTGAGR